jgi:hypothetical protein
LPNVAFVDGLDGAFADHVPPPSACRPGDSPFTQLGPRIPLVRDHTAITRFHRGVVRSAGAHDPRRKQRRAVRPVRLLVWS